MLTNDKNHSQSINTGYSLPIDPTSNMRLWNSIQAVECIKIIGYHEPVRITTPRVASSSFSPLPDADLEVLFDHRTWAAQDRVFILVWTGEMSLTDVLAKHGSRFNWRMFRRTPTGRVIPVEVRYAGEVIARCEIAERRGIARFDLKHSGGRQDPAAFSIRYDSSTAELSHHTKVRAAIRIRTRPETEIELLAERLFSPQDSQPQSYVGVSELLALKRALIR